MYVMSGLGNQMDAKQKKQARWRGWILVALGPVSVLTLLIFQGADLDLTQLLLSASMLLPTLFGLAVLSLLKRIEDQDQDLIL